MGRGVEWPLGVQGPAVVRVVGAAAQVVEPAGWMRPASAAQRRRENWRRLRGQWEKRRRLQVRDVLTVRPAAAAGHPYTIPRRSNPIVRCC